MYNKSYMMWLLRVRKNRRKFLEEYKMYSKIPITKRQAKRIIMLMRYRDMMNMMGYNLK